MGGGTILYERQGVNLNYVFMCTDWGSSLQGWDEILAWDTRNETSYEETLHVAIASNCAYYDLFYDLCLMLLCLAIWARIVSDIGDGNGMGWSRAFRLDELAFSCFQMFYFSPQPLVPGSLSLDSAYDSQGSLSLSDFVLSPQVGGCNANRRDEERTM
ncbi:hypothetical protein VN97_g6965 [Penicillium thymicola]|uniref:Uncharacterized protein n=1 Tax=Penicillium thymicola TaxID=293382 RepID=A0AAI9TFT1_PENTH|nr:hypothetical protein VN97_g6965 [Penicillium thymicola]